MEQLKAPFPWFGGKSKIAHHVWSRFLPGGKGIDNYVEPFAGSLAILLQRPFASINSTIIETVNDFDCYVSNFWRSIKEDPEGVAKYADYPVSEIDLIATNNELVDLRPEFKLKMAEKRSFYDPKIAGWWVWGLSQWIGGGFCDRKVSKKLPHLGGGEGIHSRGPVSVKRKFSVMTKGGQPLHAADEFLSLQGEAIKYRFEVLSNRLRTVRIACGDWTEIMGQSVLTGNGITGIVLDPPYTADIQSVKYAGDTHQAAGRDIADEVRRWAIDVSEKYRDDPKGTHAGPGGRVKIALFGYESEKHPMPKDWEVVAWKATGGFGSQGKVERKEIEYDPANAFGKTLAERERESIISVSRGRENAGKERIWFSPSCDRVQQSLLDEMAVEEGQAA